MITPLKYDKSLFREWNDFVARSKNATFLVNRDFMDYHANRFVDASLVLRDEKGHIRALLPANYDAAARTVVSHGGLTYGGLVVGDDAGQVAVGEMLRAAADFYARTLGAESLVYKPTPYIYHRLPAEEDLYALTSMGASLTARAVSTTVVPAAAVAYSTNRRRCIAKARKAQLTVDEAPDSSSPLYAAFHAALAESLRLRHATAPVHSLAEMQLLASRFPDNIRLFVVRREGEVLAGCWVFETPAVVHTQYLLNSEAGRLLGAEDLLLDHLITRRYAAARYIDFGISTENSGRYLNENLIRVKEGFGGRSVCYDTYTLPLAPLRG